MALLPNSLPCSKCPSVKKRSNTVPVILSTPTQSIYPSLSSFLFLTHPLSFLSTSSLSFPPSFFLYFLPSFLSLFLSSLFTPLPHTFHCLTCLLSSLCFLSRIKIASSAPLASAQHLPDIGRSPLSPHFSPPPSRLQSYLNLTHPPPFLSFPLLSILF